MSKVYDYFKDKIEHEMVPSMNEVEQSADYEEMITVMKQAKKLLEQNIDKDAEECIHSLKDQINKAEEIVHQFDLQLIDMEKEEREKEHDKKETKKFFKNTL